MSVFSNRQLLVVFEHRQGGSEAVSRLGVLNRQAHDERVAGVGSVVRHAVSAAGRSWAHVGCRVRPMLDHSEAAGVNVGTKSSRYGDWVRQRLSAIVFLVKNQRGHFTRVVVRN